MRVTLAALLVLLACAPASLAGQAGPAEPQAAIATRVEPSRRERELASYDAIDRTAPPARNGIVFLGSSTIVDWDVVRYFPDLTIINRGLWGSSLSDAVRYADRLVLPYEPRLVVLYAGDNDINAGALSEEVAVEFERFVSAIHAKLPGTRIVFIGIKPSIQRWTQVHRMRAANQIIRDFSERDDRVAFLDVDGVMLGWDEKPRRELFLGDGLHLSPLGYQLWSTLLRPFLAR